MYCSVYKLSDYIWWDLSLQAAFCLAGDNTSTPAQEPHDLLERTVGFVLEYENDDPLDPRELSELPDIRLWFVRLDAAYPWLPIVVDWRAGELSRYAAMLVPHQVGFVSSTVFGNDVLQ